LAVSQSIASDIHSGETPGIRRIRKISLQSMVIYISLLQKNHLLVAKLLRDVAICVTGYMVSLR
jgi:hypothetical protein